MSEWTERGYVRLFSYRVALGRWERVKVRFLGWGSLMPCKSIMLAINIL